MFVTSSSGSLRYSWKRKLILLICNALLALLLKEKYTQQCNHLSNLHNMSFSPFKPSKMTKFYFAKNDVRPRTIDGNIFPALHLKSSAVKIEGVRVSICSEVAGQDGSFILAPRKISLSLSLQYFFRPGWALSLRLNSIPPPRPVLY